MRNFRRNNRRAALLALSMASVFMVPSLASAESVLRIGMTAADIPRTLGQPDQGFEGNRFTGLTMYDALTMWDLSSATKASVVIPGLATEWKVEDADHTKWIFKLRPGVKFHDGSDFNADAVVWNVDKVLNKEAPQYDPSQIGVTASRMPTLVSAKKIDDLTVELTTKEPDSFLPINLTNLFMASPTKWQALYGKAEGADAKAKSTAAWAAFAKDASGTGPWKMAKFTPRERLELTKNDGYWDKNRVPHVDRMVLLPMPEANARTAALLSGQVDWIEAPAPDAVKEIEGRGFKIEKNEQPHVWPWQFSRIEGSPWNDIRVRRAANLCIDREGMRDGLLSGLMVPATGTFEPGHPWRGKPQFQIKYDLPAAQKLMKEAGFGPNKKLTVKVQTSASGSGQMLPLPMNEYLQQALAECYFDVKLDVIEWNTLFTNWRRGVKDPSANGSDAINVTYAAMDPFFALVRFLQSSMAPPVSNNWGYINNPKFDELVKKARTTFTDKERDDVLAELNAASIDDAAFLYVAHDVGPRALSPKIKGFVQPKSWFVDFSPVSIAP
ncbi:ABC transporter substrate-binding protein [Rhodopseudomonas palustris]|uniref:ABC transporter substrate-binding protein n=1 Tax=Rhodopseudomonas palustris (strain ATCC BAA-98 / CGA009) TaxID=258594 RepID=Q6NBR7_RHOPA|nr:ABC transporter substrate-binding protein [Rhodopseudomonas palustris]OPF94797.1 ABC transporter substrate-binding protein [Rhodopseudomonas palustris]PPQ45050.1 ABC transporter substrate-binding protein [Rhodopseudomonas palustris]QQM02253.1 Periplasmic dipeptide transport protein [Rhodopseudomonas palustris]RJF63707.1 ABC transporter substrate-binding protein [Rhodopseudomonas palustris]WAB78457.1 ABC transporter substrate-binding protein [Rhodopseudomonas palustris]